MKISGATIFLGLVTLNINRYVFGWKVQTHSCSSTNGLDLYHLDGNSPAVKLFFINVQIALMASHHRSNIFGTDQRCTTRIVSENGTFIGVRMLQPYSGMSNLYTGTHSRRIFIRDVNGLDTSFTSNYLPIADITSSTNDVNVTITDNPLASSLSVLIYQFRRGMCRSDEYKCSNYGLCLNNKLFNNDFYDFCNTEGLTTTYRSRRTNNDYSNDSSFSSSSSGVLTVFLVILFVVVLVIGGCGCFCSFCNIQAKNNDQNSDVHRQNSDENDISTAVNTISNRHLMPRVPSYSGIHMSGIEQSTSSTSYYVNTAPPDYDTLKFDSFEMPPSYDEIISKSQEQQTS